MNYYLGIDIGTTSSKAVAFSEKGTVLSSVSIGYDMQHPLPNQSEQDPDEIFDAVVSGITETLAAMLPHTPVFISFSAAMHSLLAIDKQGNLLTQCIIWADNRADVIAENLKHSEEGKYCYHETGVPVHSMSPLSKLLWLKENDAETFKAAYKFIGIKEYIFYKLFDEFVIDTSVASATGLLQTKSLHWDKQILNMVGITEDQLSKIVSTKEVFHYNNKHTSLQFSASIPFIIGASDGASANLGTAAMGDAMAITIGTSGAARLVVNTPVTDSRMRTFCYHLKDDLYIAGGANNNGAIVLQWLKDSILQSNDAYTTLFEQAASVGAGSNGLILLPYILGERAPLWNANAKGVYFGLTINHTKAHLIRATIEAVVFSMYSIGKILMSRQPVTAIHASGGFAKSDVWLQIVADVFNVKVIVSGAYEAAALGAVMLGTEAMQHKDVFENKLLASYIPDANNHATYQAAFQKFERLYELLQYEMLTDAMVQAPN
ncbi:MAG: gluconokinase [Bacteroidota bacterium]